MFRDLPRYPEMTVNQFWDAKAPSHWETHPGLAVLEENRRKNHGLVESQVLSLSFGRVVVKPVEKQRGLVPDSYENYQILDPGDIVIRPTDLQNDQTSIRVGHVKERGIITSAYIGLRAHGAWSDAYAYHYLAVVDSSKRIYGMGTGLRQQLGWPDLKRMPCLVPPTDEQAAIVKYLAHAIARIDKAIAAKRRLIALLEEQQRAGTEFVIHEVASDAVEPLLGRALRRIEQGMSPPAVEGDFADDQWAVLSLSAVNRGVFSPTAVKPVAPSLEVPTRLELSDGDLLMTRSNTRDRVGDVAVVAGVRPRTLMSDLIYRLKPIDALLNTEFASHLLRSRRVRDQIESLARGSSGTMPKLAQSHIKSLRVPLPSLEVQSHALEEISRRATPLRDAVERTSREIALLQEFRTRLVADVVTGQVDVRAIAATLPEAPECESSHLNDPIHTLESDFRDEELVDD